eukprot:PhF_6_TR39843/c0_g3_i1/m.59246
MRRLIVIGSTRGCWKNVTEILKTTKSQSINTYTTPPRVPKEKMTSAQREYFCYCDFTTESVDEFTNHMSSVHHSSIVTNESGVEFFYYDCKYCNATYPIRSKLADHLLMVHHDELKYQRRQVHVFPALEFNFEEWKKHEAQQLLEQQKPDNGMTSVSEDVIQEWEGRNGGAARTNNMMEPFDDDVLLQLTYPQVPSHLQTSLPEYH